MTETVPSSASENRPVCLVAQWGLTLCDPMDCSLPGSSVHVDSPGEKTEVDCPALLQRIFPARDQTQVSHIEGRFFTMWATRKAQYTGPNIKKKRYTQITLVSLVKAL